MINCDKKLTIRPRAVATPMPGQRTFLHVDLDAFFASVEQIKNPKLKGKPVIVGGRNSRRGVVAAASYEAKRCGVTTGMPWLEAQSKCPSAVFLPADFEAYAEYSEKVQKILGKIAPVVAQASVDESYLDLTGCQRLYKTPREAGEKIYRAVKDQTGLSISIGIAGSQSVAKMASRLAKPRGMVEIPKGAEKNFLASLPVEAMPGIGPQLGEKLRGMGIVTLGQLAKVPNDLLRASFGVYGPFLRAKARGEDTWELEVTETIKSIGKQETFPEDVRDFAILKRKLFELVEKVGQKLREENLYARRVAVKVRYADFSEEGTSKTFRDPTHFDRVLFQYAEELLSNTVRLERSIRLIGFSVQELSQQTPQLDLFRTPKAERWERFYSSLDKIRSL
ncbi:MAG: DNA polymerase IV [Deltaproteobacteria bacterium]|nr:DNA polymerase IV [Deltaproteobacteria bacterium]